MKDTETPNEVDDIITRTLLEPNPPHAFHLMGREWDQYSGVFPATMTGATDVMASILPYPSGGSLLEIGSGSGVIAVTAALRGCASVTAVDINEMAVVNTKANALKHGVAERIDARQGDLFSSIPAEARYDLIFWNVPWTYVDEPFSFRSPLHVAVFDPGYRKQRDYIAQGREFLAPNGRLLLGTADLGDRERLHEFAGASRLRIEVVRSVRRLEVHRLMEYFLLELVPLDSGAAQDGQPAHTNATAPTMDTTKVTDDGR